MAETPGRPLTTEAKPKRELSPETRAKMSENAKKRERDPVTKRWIKACEEGTKDPDKARGSLTEIDQTEIPAETNQAEAAGKKFTPLEAVITRAAAEATMAEISGKKNVTKEQEQRYKLLEEKVKAADAQINELKNDSDPLNKALGYDVEIHSVRERLIQINENIQLVEKARDLPDQTPEKKAVAEKRLFELTAKKNKEDENLKNLETQRKEIKKDGQDIPDRLVQFVEEIAGEITADRRNRPLKLLNDIIDSAVADEKSRKALIEGLKKKGILDNKQAKQLNNDLRIEIPDWNKRILKGGGIGLAGLLMMMWMAYKSSKDSGGQQG
ncbi:MAG: hypothetical protein HYW86_05170 [Candidatus Roizmanbacteria bacterium]|nr:MAG: hypothetical protein HYW86_05170 [Candidatus Roizmanbacteria bacterium]